MRRLVTLAVVLAVCAPLSACGSASRSPAESMAASVLAAGLAQMSVHWTESEWDCSAHLTSDVSAHAGTQWITTKGCRWGKGKAQVVLVDGVAYVRGDPGGLESDTTIDLTPAEATRYAGRWIAIPKSHEFYPQLAAGLTLASIVPDIDLQPGDYKLRMVRKTAGGTRLVVLTAGDPDTEISTLSARAQGDPLPVAFTYRGGVGWGYRLSFSRWSEPVHVHAPASSTPITTVCGRCAQPWPTHG